MRPLYDITGVKSYGDFNGPWTQLRIKKTTVTANNNCTLNVLEEDDEEIICIARNWRAGLQLIGEGKDHYGSGYIADGSSKQSIFVRMPPVSARETLLKHVVLFPSLGKA